LEEDSNEKTKANALEIERKSSGEPVSVYPDEWETPFLSESGSIPTPYPNSTESSASSSDLKKVKTEGKEVDVKDDFEESVGDEASGGGNDSEAGFLTELVKTKVLGVPLGVWGSLIVAFVIVLLIWYSLRPIEPMEYFITHVSERMSSSWLCWLGPGGST
jgi:hypothetical protein